MKLRPKILPGFLILALMLLLAGIWAVYQLKVLGISAQRMLDENYKSIHAAQQMIESLKRQDSAILLLLLGKWEEGRSILESSDASFQEALGIAKGNITISGEEVRVEAVAKSYAAYKGIWIRPIVGTVNEGNLNWYTEQVHPAFLEVKSCINKVRDLNSTAMYESASELKDRARRAVTPGAVAVMAALVFSLLFSYFVNYYVVSPILRVTGAVQEFANRAGPLMLRSNRGTRSRDWPPQSMICAWLRKSRERETNEIPCRCKVRRLLPDPECRILDCCLSRVRLVLGPRVSPPDLQRSGVSSLRDLSDGLCPAHNRPFRQRRSRHRGRQLSWVLS
jgi:hypothetical protein